MYVDLGRHRITRKAEAVSVAIFERGACTAWKSW